LDDLHARVPIRIFEQENTGYGAGLNRGMRELTDPSGLVLLCNPDISLSEPGGFREAVAYLSAHPETGCVIPSLLNCNRLTGHAGRRFYTPATLLLSRLGRLQALVPGWTRNHLYHAQASHEPRTIDWGCGAAMLCRLSLFPNPLSFDERFFLYFEDVDLCARLWQAGYSVVHYPGWTCLHGEQKRSRREFLLFTVHVMSMLKYVRKYRGLPKREDLFPRR
jgi:GT2 family glycosyltransferase